MNKKIETLVNDIYDLFNNGHKVDINNVQVFANNLTSHIAKRLTEAGDPKSPHLRLSNLGTPCQRKLWYTVNQPETAEPLSPEAKIKFMFGDILEHMLLFLAKEAGHKVEGEQDEVDYQGIKGHRDAIIDGELVDVKSASSYSFNKFNDHLSPDSDAFGYLTQLGTYKESSREDPRLVREDRGHFLVIDKQLGKICLDTHTDDELNTPDVKEIEAIIAEDRPPARPYSDVPDGKSGNKKLDIACSYCEFKQTCWPQLRTFLYANGPKFLTEVRRLPDVHEIKD